MQTSPLASPWLEPTDTERQSESYAGGTCVQDWYEQALQSFVPVRGPRNSWDDEEEEEEPSDDPEAEDDLDADEDIQADPFDDFDPEDFDDEFDDDFEEELEDEYEIEPEDDEIMEDLDSPSIVIDDGSADEADDDAEPIEIPDEDLED